MFRAAAKSAAAVEPQDVAGERLLGFAIGLVDKAALWATPAGVARVNDDNRNASALCLLGQELAQLTKRPPMQTAALRLPGMFNPKQRPSHWANAMGFRRGGIL
jgi:hypothetical protein